jgi:hypothetical protein
MWYLDGRDWQWLGRKQPKYSRFRFAFLWILDLFDRKLVKVWAIDRITDITVSSNSLTGWRTICDLYTPRCAFMCIPSSNCTRERQRSTQQSCMHSWCRLWWRQDHFHLSLPQWVAKFQSRKWRKRQKRPCSRMTFPRTARTFLFVIQAELTPDQSGKLPGKSLTCMRIIPLLVGCEQGCRWRELRHERLPSQQSSLSTSRATPPKKINEPAHTWRQISSWNRLLRFFHLFMRHGCERHYLIP